MVKDRHKICKSAKVCFQCLRLDSEVDLSDVKTWRSNHQNACDSSWLCKEDGCHQKPPHRQYNILLCTQHIQQNKQREGDIITDFKLKPGIKLFSHMQLISYSLPPFLGDENVQPDVNCSAIFMLQKLKFNGEDLVLFFDSGCYGWFVYIRPWL